MLRARHTGTSRASTRAITRGSRCASSSASAISVRAEVVEISIAAANGSAENAATIGRPSPPIFSGQSRSPPTSPNPAAHFGSSTVLVSHQRIVACSTASAAAASRALACSANHSTESRSRSSTHTGPPARSVSISMLILKHHAPTVHLRRGCHC